MTRTKHNGYTYTYSQYVHSYRQSDGSVRYVVACYVQEKGIYRVPIRPGGRRNDYLEEKSLDVVIPYYSYPTRRQALRRARYIYGGR